jgi:hypothetical protein
MTRKAAARKAAQARWAKPRKRRTKKTTIGFVVAMVKTDTQGRVWYSFPQ